jgi:hypothetical protein
MRSSRRFGVAFLFTVGIGLGGCSGGGAPATCATGMQCPATSRCIESACVGNTAPTARFAAPAAPIEAFELVSLDGSDSSDPDEGDAITSFAWTARALTASCEPPVIAGTGATAQLRFGCAGRYAIELVVTDQLAAQGEPRTVEIEVAEPSAPSRVQVSPDSAVDHSCSGDPTLCRSATVSLWATAPDLTGVAFRWTVQAPPGRPLGQDRRAVFLPGPDVDATSFSIESDGGAISGDWVLRVEARDAVGVVGAATTRVSVRNRDPIVTGTALASYPHVFEGVSARFVSVGMVPFSVVDPDGDPLEPVHATFRHLADRGGSFDGVVAAGEVTFRIEVPYATPEDALGLIGGPGLQRTVELFVRDVNDGTGTASFAIEVGNTPPAPVGTAATLTVPHTFDPLTQRYVASVSLPSWADPEGDPLFVVSAGPAPCDSVQLFGANPVVECSVAYEGTPAVGAIAGARSVQVVLADPWAAGAEPPSYTLNILNRPPSLEPVPTPSSITCTRTSCCDYEAELRLCLAYNTYVSAIEITAAPVVSDPDGDPVLVTAKSTSGGSVTPAARTCLPGECGTFAFSERVAVWCGSSPGSGALAGWDGLAMYTVSVLRCP